MDGKLKVAFYVAFMVNYLPFKVGREVESYTETQEEKREMHEIVGSQRTTGASVGDEKSCPALSISPIEGYPSPGQKAAIVECYPRHRHPRHLT